MMNGGETEAFKRLFPKKYVPIILSSLLQAGAALRKKTDEDREDWITRRLCAQLIRIPEFRDGPLNVSTQSEIVSPDPDADSPAGRIDLLVSCSLGYEVYFAVEAKRLRVCSSNGRLDSGSDKYVNDGMMRFVIGQYAPFMESGAMLGYVFDGKTSEARSGVDRYVRKKVKELKLMPPKQLTQSGILSNKPVDQTCHDLKNRIFIIYHIFLAI